MLCFGGKVKKVIVLLMLFLIFGCGTTFHRVDFKYSNLAHMDIKDGQRKKLYWNITQCLNITKLIQPTQKAARLISDVM